MANWQTLTDGDGIGAANGNYQYLGGTHMITNVKKPTKPPPGKPYGPPTKPPKGGRGK